MSNTRRNFPFFEVGCLVCLLSGNIIMLQYFLNVGNQPTNEMNLELRQQFAGIIHTEIVLAMNIAAAVLYDKVNTMRKDKDKEKEKSE